MKTGNEKPIVKKLFRTYILCMILCVLVLLIGTVCYSGYLINRNIIRTQKQLSLSINQNIENYFRRMDDFSMSLIKKQRFRQIALKELPEAYRQKHSTVDLFSELYLESHEMIQKKYNIGIITQQQYYVWMGNEYRIGQAVGEAYGLYSDYAMDGSAAVRYPDKNENLEGSMEKQQAIPGEVSKIVLARSFGEDNILYNGKAILEVWADAEDFAHEIQELSSGEDAMGFQVYVVNSAGEEIFAEPGWDEKAFLEETDWNTGSYYKNGTYTFVYRIFDSQMYVLYHISVFQYYNRLILFVAVVLLFFFLVTLVMAGVNYLVSRQISRPLHQVCEELEKIDLERGIRYCPVKTDIREFNYLSLSIAELTARLEESIKHIVKLKEYEIQSRMLALQAQMQPHFLVNTLMTMGTMAEEAGNRDVFQMCMNLTQMFRYISSEEREGVNLFEEIRHVERYVGIMRERFPNVQVKLDIPLELMDIRIPKLILQPLVENSFKHANCSRLHIQVTGTLEEKNRWSILVSDNGEGFTEEKAADIMERCKKAMDGINSLSAKVDGMGLANVYVRLHLFYRDAAVYKIGKEGITIGGKV